MARSRQKAADRRRLVYYVAVPVLVLALSVVAYVALVPPALSCQNTTPAMNYSVQISIQYATTNSTGGRGIQFVIPKGAGEAGLAWNSHTFDANGLDCRYPVYMDPPNPGQPYSGFSQIWVVSTIYHNYTLGDFFSVWGMSIGQNDTINIQSAHGNQWSMCVGPSQSTQRPGLWGQEPLVDGNSITLLYDNIGCI